jgi:hypothetical protein
MIYVYLFLFGFLFLNNKIVKSSIKINEFVRITYMFYWKTSKQNTNLNLLRVA